MALQVSAQTNGVAIPSPAEEEELYAQLLRLEDAVLSGRHPLFKLPPAAIEQLKASLIAMNVLPTTGQASVNGDLNGVAFAANAAANHAQQSATPAKSSFPGLPGLQVQPPALKPSSSGGLDPIFLEKSDSLVRAEAVLKRQRIERELQAQMEQRRHTRDKDQGADAPSVLDVETILLQSGARESHVSGLKAAKAASPASSFDENDYYSSQVQSDWSSPDSADKGSDRAAGAFAADLERANGPNASFGKGFVAGKQPMRDPHHQDSTYPAEADMYDAEDDDDEYAPPDATAFDSFTGLVTGGNTSHSNLAEEEDSDYEPGEITQESNLPTPHHQGMRPAQPSPRMTVIRNHLTHIAAPQPNRVSPLAVAKRPSIELELVNGRPEVVHKLRSNHHAIDSRASTASPPANGAPGSNKKRRTKKRKREVEPTSRSKRKRDRQNAAQSPATARQEPRIKDEPVSPPPFATASDIPQYAQRPSHYQVPEIDLVSPRYAPLPAAYIQETPRSALRYEYAQATSPAVITAPSPTAYRPVQRDTQDLRRVASLHHAQAAPTLTSRTYSPAPQRTASMTYGDPRLSRASVAPIETESMRYAQPPAQEDLRYTRQRSRSPPRLQEYNDPYARVQSPAVMPPPSARRIVVDQYGNRYYAADPAPAPAPMPVRASVAPVERRSQVDVGYERAPSRMTSAYGQPPSSVPQYETGATMAPPPIPRRQVPEDPRVQYVDAGYRTRDYSMRPVEEQVRYIETPASPVYQAQPQYEQMLPPPPRMQEPTSPVYTPSRSYSVRPEDSTVASAYPTRQASVAPVQYLREAPAAPTRAMSVAPTYAQPPSRAYSLAPQQQPVRYVDQYGREVYPEVGQVPAPGYRYQ